MEYNKRFFEKVFSNKRMERYFALYPNDEDKAIRHYQSNIQLTEAFYTSLSVLEVALRNALSRELETMTGREDWYAIFPNIPGLTNLNRYVTQASKQIAGRHEQITPSKIIAELTLGFWVSLLNAEYERLLWKDLRRAFPYLPKKERQRKNVSAPLNRFRAFRNRVFHNESICWNLRRVQEIHSELLLLLGWINKDLPEWLTGFDRFDEVQAKIKAEMEWS
ncbi:MAG: Abi family protein [Bacteroidaceae bacterium]|nr:Abi family protein [Bacteroidaceae bacterium]